MFGFGVGIQRLGSFGVDTEANLHALPDPGAAMRPTGFVFANSDTARNGIYTWTGSAWQRVRGLPEQLAVLTITGGTANAIVASAQAGVDLSQIVGLFITPSVSNTGAVTLNGTPVKDYDGSALPAGAFAAGKSYFLVNRDTEYRVMFDALHAISDVTGLQTALDGKATAAQGAKADSAVQPSAGVFTGDLSTSRNSASIAASVSAINTSSATNAIADLQAVVDNNSHLISVRRENSTDLVAEETPSAGVKRKFVNYDHHYLRGRTGGNVVENQVFRNGVWAEVIDREMIKTLTLQLDAMRDPATIADIINRVGLTPNMRGAKDGDADHSPYINDAIDRVEAAKGGAVILPPMPNDWNIGQTIKTQRGNEAGAYLVLKGLGDKARLKWLNTTGDMITIGNGNSPVYYVTLEKLYLYAGGGAKTSGIDIKAVKANCVNIIDVITDGSYQGFYGEDLNSVYHRLVTYNMPNQTSGAGVTIRSDPSTSGRSDIVKFDETTVQAYNAGSYGLVIDGRVAGVHTDGFYALGTRRGLQLNSSGSGLSDIPSFCFFEKFEIDRATDIGIVLVKGFRTEFLRLDASNTSGALDTPYPQGNADDCAMYIDQSVVDTKIIGGRIGNCRKEALRFYGKNLLLLGTTLSDMSKAGSAQAAALYLGATANGFSVRDLTVEGMGRASVAVQMEAATRNGRIDGIKYKDVVNGYAAGTGTNVTNTNQLLCDYTY